ncbi:hypothetical protein NPIL_100741 [Nephila pilipes]|uniref:Uncharacterized protein n=1 Tax=Nephila pilipes TaxID=299642 RepID=A0A8X6Q5L2_NEPPI|nr:hypothetical protein NPIL_100741 [Nephila pilipes]
MFGHRDVASMYGTEAIGEGVSGDSLTRFPRPQGLYRDTVMAGCLVAARDQARNSPNPGAVRMQRTPGVTAPSAFWKGALGEGPAMLVLIGRLSAVVVSHVLCSSWIPASTPSGEMVCRLKHDELPDEPLQPSRPHALNLVREVPLKFGERKAWDVQQLHGEW